LYIFRKPVDRTPSTPPSMIPVVPSRTKLHRKSIASLSRRRCSPARCCSCRLGRAPCGFCAGDKWRNSRVSRRFHILLYDSGRFLSRPEFFPSPCLLPSTSQKQLKMFHRAIDRFSFQPEDPLGNHISRQLCSAISKNHAFLTTNIRRGDGTSFSPTDERFQLM